MVQSRQTTARRPVASPHGRNQRTRSHRATYRATHYGPVRVGEQLGKGGQGHIYEVEGSSDFVFKRLKDEALVAAPDLERRLAAMVAKRPAGWHDRSGHVCLAWPVDAVFEGGRFVGYLMPWIDPKDAAEVHFVSNPSVRRDPGAKTPDWVRGFTWKYLLRTAANLALATDALHRGGIVFGDFNERNILVTKEARVTFVDCDSMQVPNPDGGEFLCKVWRPEFTAPELGPGNLKSVARKRSSDLFPLAVHIHQLLLEGVHPFDGVWHGRGEKPKRRNLAIHGLYVHAGDKRLTPQPLAVDYELIPKSLQDLFSRAFVAGAQDPSARPTGREWHVELNKTQRHLKTCTRRKSAGRHIYPDHLDSCPWCKHEALVAEHEALVTEHEAVVAALARAHGQRARTPATPPVTPPPSPPVRRGFARYRRSLAFGLATVFAVVGMAVGISALEHSSPATTATATTVSHATFAVGGRHGLGQLVGAPGQAKVSNSSRSTGRKRQTGSGSTPAHSHGGGLGASATASTNNNPSAGLQHSAGGSASISANNNPSGGLQGTAGGSGNSGSGGGLQGTAGGSGNSGSGGGLSGSAGP
jgi:DNA-binding helix-hairpin-helix protein with protein kinase domain